MSEDLSEASLSAFLSLLGRAEEGDPNAQEHLGNLYLRGMGVEQDLQKAFRWHAKLVEFYRGMAQQGDANAQYFMGLFYQDGRGVKLCSVRAAEWFKKAARQRHAGALLGLGELYLKGKGVRQNTAKAIKLFEASDDAGCNVAAKILQSMEKYQLISQCIANEDFHPAMVRRLFKKYMPPDFRLQ